VRGVGGRHERANAWKGAIVNAAVARWLRHVAEYPAALAQSGMRDAMERSDLGGILREVARKAEHDGNLTRELARDTPHDGEFRELVREANAMLGLDVDPASEWGDWRRRVSVALNQEAQRP
jgi:hypothetical protein